MAAPGSSNARLSAVVTLVVIAAVAYAWSTGRMGAPAMAPAAGEPAATATNSAPATPASASTERPPADSARTSAPAGTVMRHQRITDERGRLVYEGDIDLGPTFARIAAGVTDAHRNDGSVFANRERRLPPQPRGYYTEWVIRTEGVRGAGPQRLIIGQGGEAYYTPDHYATFVRVRTPS